MITVFACLHPNCVFVSFRPLTEDALRPVGAAADGAEGDPEDLLPEPRGREEQQEALPWVRQGTLHKLFSLPSFSVQFFRCWAKIVVI